MTTEFQSFAICDDETDYEYDVVSTREEAEDIALGARDATGRDYYVDPRRELPPSKLPTRQSDNDEMELARATVRLSDLSRAARTPDQFNSVLGNARDLATEFLILGRPIPASVATAASGANKMLSLVGPRQAELGAAKTFDAGLMDVGNVR